MLGLIAAPLKTGAATGGPGGRMLLLAYAKDALKPEDPSFSGRPVWLLAASSLNRILPRGSGAVTRTAGGSLLRGLFAQEQIISFECN